MQISCIVFLAFWLVERGFQKLMRLLCLEIKNILERGSGIDLELCYSGMRSWSKQGRQMSRYYTTVVSEIICVIAWLSSHMWARISVPRTVRMRKAEHMRSKEKRS